MSTEKHTEKQVFQKTIEKQAKHCEDWERSSCGIQVSDV